MAKLLVGLSWLLVVFDFGALAKANRLAERLLIEKFFEDQFERISNLTERQVVTRLARTIPNADGSQLNFYALPVGQGDAQVLQCPNGDITIVDLGSVDGKSKRFWATNEIQEFLSGHYQNIKNIVVTHNDEDHYSLFSEVFPLASQLSNLGNIYISCDGNALEGSLKTWIQDLEKDNKNRNVKIKLETFNGGRTCGSGKNTVACDRITLCPGYPPIETEVVLANAGDCNRAKKDDYDKNTDSIVIRITYGGFGMLLTGDFEGATPKLISAVKSGPPITVYKLAHHGASALANKKTLLDAVNPKAVFVSANPWFTYGHPMCSVFDLLKNLCEPENDSGVKSCGKHPISGLNRDQRLQEEYTCGAKQNNRLTRVARKTNDAIYTTTPTEDTINLIRLVTNGVTWGFVNNFYP